MVSADSTTTLCIRCGKPRIFSRRWKERVDGKGTVITHEEYVCQDSECQKIVDTKFEEMRARRLGLEERKNNIRISKQKITQSS